VSETVKGNSEDRKLTSCVCMDKSNPLGNRRNQRSIVLSTCSEDSGTPRTLSSIQYELMDGRSVRERERKRIPEGNTQNSALVRIEGKASQTKLHTLEIRAYSNVVTLDTAVNSDRPVQFYIFSSKFQIYAFNTTRVRQKQISLDRRVHCQ
jgi:hypothetical protein